MHYDGRFFTKNDVWHRVYEFSTLVVLATAVLHIRPVAILSNPMDNPDMFIYCISIAIGLLFTIGRQVEVLIAVDGQHCAKVSARRDILWSLPGFFFVLAGTIVAGVKTYGQTDGSSNGEHQNVTAYDDDHHASATINLTYPDKIIDTPIWLFVGGGLAFIAGLSSMIACLPGGGRHKECV